MKLSRTNKTLYNSLMKLCETTEEFFYRDEVTVFNNNVRIFHYRMAFNIDWTMKNALEARGITFLMENGEPVKIICRPMQKFFNYGENGKMPKSPVVMVSEKLDGSLVSSYVDNGIVRLKSKTTLFSDVAVEATNLLYHPHYEALRDWMEANPDVTVDFEYTSPENRIVVQYHESELRILNIRANDTGEEYSLSDLVRDATLRPYLVTFSKTDTEHFTASIDTVVNDYEGVEGIIAHCEDGTRFKIKSNWYLGIHKVKDAALYPNNLVYYVTESETDDLKSAFMGDWASLERIELFEKAFRDLLHLYYTTATEFVPKHLGLPRSKYAEAAVLKVHELDDLSVFNMLMLCVGGIDYDAIQEYAKKHFVRNYKLYIPEDKVDWK